MKYRVSDPEDEDKRRRALKRKGVLEIRDCRSQERAILHKIEILFSSFKSIYKFRLITNRPKNTKMKYWRACRLWLWKNKVSDQIEKGSYLEWTNLAPNSTILTSALVTFQGSDQRLSIVSVYPNFFLLLARFPCLLYSDYSLICILIRWMIF